MGALYKGFIVTAITSLIILYPVTDSIVGLSDSIQIMEKILMVWTYTFVDGWFYNYRVAYLDY